MEILLLPDDSAADGEAAADRLPRVEELLAGLRRHGESVEVFAYLPAGSAVAQSALIGFLIEQAREERAAVHLVVRRPLLAEGVLDHPYLPAVGHLIVEIDRLRSVGDGEVAALAGYARTVAGRQRLTVWMENDLEAGGSELRRLLAIARAVPEVASPEFRLGDDAGSAHAGLALTSRPALAGDRCPLFDTTLTLDPGGRVLVCPRHEGEDGPDLGAIPGESLDALLLKKGRVAAALHRFGRCRSCRLPGRFFWRGTRQEATARLVAAGARDLAVADEAPPIDWVLALKRDVSTLSKADFERVLGLLAKRLEAWARTTGPYLQAARHRASVSIETPVVKVGWLLPCIESVLEQSSPRWRFSLLWDGGDERSRRILEVLERLDHPHLAVHFGSGIGIARARRYLTERSSGDYILPLDDDDVLSPDAVEVFLAAAAAMPWSGIIRARRDFIDEAGERVEMEDWFPFESRKYQRGMTRDMYNHSQPYLIARRAYDRTAGWEGFAEYQFAGEDCDIFAKIEEVAEIELLDAVLYSYRLSGERTSHRLGGAAAEDMWRRLATATVERRDLALRLDNTRQPFEFSPRAEAPPNGTGIALLLLDATGDRAAERREEWSASTGVAVDEIHLIAPGGNADRDLAAALERCRAPRLCLLRAEDLADPAAILDRLAAELERRDADLLAPKLVDRVAGIVAADPYFDSDMLPALRTRAGSDDGSFAYVSAAPWLPATLLLVRRCVFRSVGVPDGALGGALQDADFSLRARSRGFRSVYLGELSAVCRAAAPADPSPAASHRFKKRWSRYPSLLFPEEAALV